MTLEARTNNALDAAEALSHVADFAAIASEAAEADTFAAAAEAAAVAAAADAVAAEAAAVAAEAAARTAALDAVLISVCIAEGSKTTLLYPAISLSSSFRVGHP